MSELEFWSRLEYRISDEMGSHWCDGLRPSHYFLDKTPPKIVGEADVVRGDRYYHQWAFTLVLPQTVVTIENLDWEKLIPPKRFRGWVWLNPDARHLRIALPNICNDHD